MTDDIVIRAEGLGKKYLIGHEAERGRYVALRDVIARNARNALRMAADMARGRIVVPGDTVEEVWALKDISFEVKRGEVLGIIGRNGAGKSTLLKVLSRITEPSEGRVTIKGRVASLLEVGTGFHPELTGRENIYLNGAILGMTRAEIKRKFDEIVAFAEVEKFLDTPVKRYSSGMYVRLAFAVAAHLEPEILVVDEVLSVGDAEFQKKSLGKMNEVAGHGRTVLFVSHNLPAVTALCSSAMLLKSGGLIFRGASDDVVTKYLGEADISNTVRGRRIDLAARALPTPSDAPLGISLEFQIALRGPLNTPRVGIGVNDTHGNRIATVFTETCSTLPSVDAGCSYTCTAVTEPISLAPGTLALKVSLADHGVDIEVHEDEIQVIIPEYSPFKKAPYGRPRGPLLVPLKRITEQHEEAVAVTA